jgi:hypothetical protein
MALEINGEALGHCDASGAVGRRRLQSGRSGGATLAACSGAWRRSGARARRAATRGAGAGSCSGCDAVARGCTVERRSGGAGNYGGTWELEQMVAMAARA